MNTRSITSNRQDIAEAVRILKATTHDEQCNSYDIKRPLLMKLLRLLEA